MIINATLCYIRKEDKLLMLHRNKSEQDLHKGFHNGLGGKLQRGESPQDCVIREVKEESGLTIKNPVLVGILTFPYFDRDNNDWYVFVYTVSEFSGELKENHEGTLVWVHNTELFSLPLWEGDKYFLPYVVKGEFFEGVFEYNKERKLIGWEIMAHK